MKLLQTSLRILKWPLGVLLVLNIENFAEFLGVDNLITSIFTAPEAFAWMFTPKATYIYMLMLAFIMGHGLNEFLKKFESGETNEEDNFNYLTLDIENMIGTLRESFHRFDDGATITNNNFVKSGPKLEPLRALYSQISALKIKTPKVPNSLNGGAFGLHLEFLEGLENYSKSGDLKGARKYTKRYNSILAKARKWYKDFWD